MKTAIERFLSKISVVDSGCWEWTAGKNKDGYGVFSFKKTMGLAHRFIYEYYNGNLDSNLSINHICRNRKCVNPEHLEQITWKENILKGIGLSAINKRKTHCIHGHEFNEKNTHININGKRRCRKCDAILHNKKRERLVLIN